MTDSRKTQHFLKGQVIVAEGAEGDRTFKIISGEVLICKHNKDQDVVPIAKLGAGELFGEMYLFESGGKRSATVVAASSEVVVEVFFKDEMQELLGPINPAMQMVLNSYQKRLKKTSDTCAELSRGVVVTRLPDGRMKATERANGFTLRPDSDY